MKAKLENGEKTVERILTVSIPAKEIDGEVESRIDDFAEKAHLRGFRPGKASTRMVRQQYGKSFRQEVIGEAINKYYTEALKEKDVNPINMPKVDITIDEAGKDVEFKAVFEVIPDVEVQGLDKVTIEKVTSEVTDKDVEEVLKRLQKQHATLKDVKREAKNEDTIDINFEGFLGKEKFEGGSAENVPLVLGSGQMIEGFESGLVGVKAGEERELKLKFPKEYHAKDLAGKAVSFKVKVNKVQEAELPKLDDDLAAKFNVLTVDALKKEVRSNMARELTFKLKNIVKDQIVEALLKHNEVEAPESLIHQEIHNLKQQAAARFGLIDEKTGKMKGDLPDEMFREEAVKRCKLGVLMTSLVEHFKIKPDAKKIETALDEYTSVFEDKDEVKRQYKKDPRQMENFAQQVVEDMVVEKITAGAKVTEKKKKFFDIIDSDQMA